VGARGKGGNFVETVLAKARAGQSLRIVNDVRMSPTYAGDAARALVEAVQSDATGLLHLANQGCCTWYEFAQAVLAETGLSVDIEPVDSHSYPMKAARPKNSALTSARLDRLVSMPLRSWRSALRAYLLEKAHIPNSSHRQAPRDFDHPISPPPRRS
jgi:dTDP-4-dehydrorhamnose reductase